MPRFTIQDVTDWTLGAASDEACAAIEADVASDDSLVREYLDWLGGGPHRATPRLVAEDVSSLPGELRAALADSVQDDPGAAITSSAEEWQAERDAPASSQDDSAATDSLLPALRPPESADPPARPRPLTLRLTPRPRPPMLRDSRVAIGAIGGFIAAAFILVLIAGPDHMKQRFAQIIIFIFRENVTPDGDRAQRPGEPVQDALARIVERLDRRAKPPGASDEGVQALRKDIAALTGGKEDSPILYRGDPKEIEALRRHVAPGGSAPDPAILDLAMRARSTADTLGLLVPAYFDPLSPSDWKAGWDAIFRARAQTLDVIAVIDVVPGKDFRNDRAYPIYSRAIGEAHNQGVRVIAYVDALGRKPDGTFGDRRGGGVKQSKERIAGEIDLLCELFPIDGVFLDNQPVDPQFAVAFKEIRAFVRGIKARPIFVSNPRQPCPREYFSDTDKDIIMQAYSALDPIRYHPPDWVAAYPPGQFAGWFWGLRDPADLPSQLRHAAARHLGWIYLSDPDTRDPGDHRRLTPHWEDEVRGLGRLNQAIRSGEEPRP